MENRTDEDEGHGSIHVRFQRIFTKRRWPAPKSGPAQLLEGVSSNDRLSGNDLYPDGCRPARCEMQRPL
jgi:hypothetical protein